MPSKALTDFRQRLSEVKQLLEAHGALTRLKNAEAALNAGGQNLQNVAQVVQHLVAPIRRGRPPEVQALNSAGVALLSAHLQGFVIDLYTEVAKSTLGGKVKDLSALTESANTRGNPNEQNITRLFSSIGYPKILDGISWQRMNNKQVKAKLKAFNELRNKIVHGNSETVTKSTLANYVAVLTSFAERFDAKVEREVRSVIGAAPW
jgi:hypothetical protein